jgi:hypothetical protein
MFRIPDARHVIRQPAYQPVYRQPVYQYQPRVIYRTPMRQCVGGVCR